MSATSGSDLTASLDNLEARLASYRARSKVSSTVVSSRVASTSEEAKTGSGQPNTDYDAFITPISAANVLPSSQSHTNLSSRRQTQPGPNHQHGEFLAPTPSPQPAGPSRLSARTHSISLNNISRQDDGWMSNGEDAPDLSSTSAGGRAPARAPSASPTGLVLAYNSDGGGAGGGQSHRRKASVGGGTENMQSWAEVQAAQQAKQEALASARKRRQAREDELLRQDAEQRQRDELNSKAYPSSSMSSSSHPSVQPALPAAVYATLGSPLTARSKAAQEQQSGYLVPAADNREVLGALATFERRRVEQERTAREGRSGGAPSLPASARGTGLTPRLPGSSRNSHRTSSRQSFDPSALDQDDSSAYANSTFVPHSARLGGSARGTGSMANAQKDRRQELLERKERVRLRKQAALEAITKASTPVSQGGTLEISANDTWEHQIEGQPNGSTQQEGSTSSSSSSNTTAPRSRAETRKCEMLDFKGMGEKTCVVQ
jgi:hypothetical protein